jgi:hypothetical protein
MDFEYSLYTHPQYNISNKTICADKNQPLDILTNATVVDDAIRFVKANANSKKPTAIQLRIVKQRSTRIMR